MTTTDQTASLATWDAPATHRGPSAFTVVWGLVLATVGIVALTSDSMDWQIDASLLIPLVMVGCGALLLVASGIGALRRRRTSAASATTLADRDTEASVVGTDDVDTTAGVADTLADVDPADRDRPLL